jgi:hypothetical protein
MDKKKNVDWIKKVARFVPEGYHVFLLTHNELVKEVPGELWRMYADGILFKTTKNRTALFDCIDPLEIKYGSKIDGHGQTYCNNDTKPITVDYGSIEYDGPFTEYVTKKKKSELKIMVDDIAKWCRKRKVGYVRLTKGQAETVRKLLIAPYSLKVQI